LAAGERIKNEEEVEADEFDAEEFARLMRKHSLFDLLRNQEG
jgi:hypothetical protein